MEGFTNFILSIILSLISGLVGVLVGTWVTHHKEKRQEKISIMKVLITYVQLPGQPERVTALNMIPVVFYKNRKICTAFDNYKAAHNDAAANQYNNQIFQQKLTVLNDSYLKLVELMAKELRYSATITWDKLKNPYTPLWYYTDNNLQYFY